MVVAVGDDDFVGWEAFPIRNHHHHHRHHHHHHQRHSDHRPRPPLLLFGMHRSSSSSRTFAATVFGIPVDAEFQCDYSVRLAVHC